MTDFEKLREINEEEAKIWRKYEQSKLKDGIGEPKILSAIINCINKRAEILKLRAMDFSNQLSGRE